MFNLQPATNSFKPAMVTRLVAICWITIKLFCYKLWLGNRDFPLVPVDDLLLSLSPWVHNVCFALMLFCLVSLVFFPTKKWLIVLFMLAEIGSCLLDQNRWKPWEYQFMFMLLPLLFLKDEKKIKLSWQIIVVGLYFFSGVSKCNSGFILRVWNQMLLHGWMGITTQNPWIFRIGYALPLIEMAAAIALIIPTIRKWGVLVICLMHVLIFVMLGPATGHYNSVIWPWNVVMILVLIHLFYQNQFNLLLLTQKQLLVWAIALFWWVIPWLNLAGYWDDYFSAVLYSGKSQSLYICTSNSVTQKKYAPYFTGINKGVPCDTMLSVTNWSMQTMNIIPNPETRIYRSIIRQWKLQNDSTGADQFFILHPKHSKERWLQITAR